MVAQIESIVAQIQSVVANSRKDQNHSRNQRSAHSLRLKAHLQITPNCGVLTGGRQWIASVRLRPQPVHNWLSSAANSHRAKCVEDMIPMWKCCMLADHHHRVANILVKHYKQTQELGLLYLPINPAEACMITIADGAGNEKGG